MKEVLRSGVQAWECDRMGHWNVRFYFQKASEGLALFGAALGLAPRSLAERGLGFVARDQHVRFLRELRPGAPYRVVAGVLDAEPQRLRVYSEIQHVALEAPAATLTSELYFAELASREPVPLPEPVLRAAEGQRCELPDHGAPRGLTADPPGPAPVRKDSAGRGMVPAFLGPAPAELCDAAGYLTPAGHMACVSDGIDHYFHRTRGKHVRAVGGAALEYRYAYRTPARVGDVVEVYSALKAIGPKIKHLCHHLFDATTGDAIATSEAIAVNFDLEARRAVPLSEEERRFLEPHLIAGIGL